MPSNDPKTLAKNFSIHSFYSQIAGLAALVSTNFLEVTKIRMISDVTNCSVPHYKEKTIFGILKNRQQGHTMSFYMRNCVDCLPFRNSLLTLYYLVKSDGVVPTFFRGIDKTMASHLLRVGLFYPTFEIIKFNIKPLFPETKKEVYSSTVAAGLARSMVTLISFPFEVSKIMAQSGAVDRQQTKILSVFREIARNRASYSVVFWNFFQREMFFSVIFWYLFEKRRAQLKASDPTRQLSELRVKVNAAFCSGFVASMITYPYDVIQTNKVIHEQFKSTNSVKILRQLQQTYGWSFLLNGLFVRVAKGCCTTGIFFTVYEWLKVTTNHREFDD